GASLVREAKWSEALASFERSFALVAHPVTLFNIAACERALGNYTRARRDLLRVGGLDVDGALPAAVRADVQAFLSQISAILVTVDVHPEPASAAITVDGRPLEATAPGPPQVFTAGILPSGLGRTLDASSFRVELDPGAHVFVITRPGFSEVVRREVFGP